MVRVRSMKKSINAEVAIKTLFSRLKAAIVNPLIAPPVPRSPAENPERIPPLMAFLFVGEMIKFCLIRKSKLKPIKNMAKRISKIPPANILERRPPIMTKATDGIPIFNNSFLSKPFLNNMILLKLLVTWKIAVIPKTL